MRVALVNHRYAPFRGGSEIYVQVLAEWFSSAGWQARVITTDAHDLEYFWDPNAERVDASSHETINGVEIQRLPVYHRPGKNLTFGIVRRGMGEASRILPWSWPFNVASRAVPHIPDLEAAIVAAGPVDVVIATNLGLEGLAVRALEVARRSAAPLVLLPFAHLGDGSDQVARRYVSMPHHRALIRAADLNVALTALEAEFLEGCGVDARRIVIAGAGVHQDTVSGGNKRHLEVLFGRSPFILAALGAMAADKGTPDLVEATWLLRQRGVPVELVLAGPSMSAFDIWFAQRGADDWPWVHRVGVIGDEAKRDLLAGIDALALPSRTESFGIVFLEAWANGKPVIGSAVGAVNEVIEDGVDGLLVPFGRPDAIADAVERLAVSGCFRRKLGEAGRRKVAAHYTWSRVLERIECAFADVLGIRVR